MKRYNPKDIEQKWQKYWEASNTYTANLHSDKPKFIAMSMFNYPSGAGIHLGHALNYTISDVKARFKRQQGFESYHPVGWDSFGLPAENYAIKAGVSPQVSMATIIPSYHKQYKAMGWSNDWEKEIATHQPEYYKWTQWIFSQMYKNGLAYQDARSQWWCDSCQTVLANEQIIDGKCWRHDGVNDPIVEKREVKQWFFKITEYADELLEAIDDLDWTESVKLSQKNWIGKSIGAEIEFAVDNSGQKISVFTTRPDTIFGATFLVLAPENELVTSIAAEENKQAIDNYVHKAIQKSEVERQANKEKTGVFTGSYAINPATQEKIPIWIADYVLEGYGTGAIMAVPAHDERDHDFAKKHDLKIVRVIHNQEPDEVCTTQPGNLINSGDFNGQSSDQAKTNIVAWLQESDNATKKVNYKMRDWSVTRQRYWGAPTPIIYCADCGPILVPDENLPVILPELEDFAPSGDGRSALARASDWLVADCPNCGKQGERETDTLDTYICSSWYMLRYFDPNNQEKPFDSDIANKWMPIDFYNGGDHATAHLLYARFITRFFTKIGLLKNPEPFKQMLYNGKVTASDGTMFSKSKGNGIDPLEIIDSGYGADALRTYLMFASPLELWTKWDPQGVPGTYRFLTRVWNLVQEYTELPEGNIEDGNSTSILHATHRMIQKVTHDLEQNLYNTAIAASMGCLNELYKQKSVQIVRCSTWQTALESMVMSIAPFAPHIADELWQDLGHSDSVHVDHWPELDEKYLIQETTTLAVQVNGKVRAEIEVSAEASKEEIEEMALAQENVQAHLAGSEPKKIIYVTGRLVSIVV
jgi:leucyl-tRNA synthetase